MKSNKTFWQRKQARILNNRYDASPANVEAHLELALAAFKADLHIDNDKSALMFNVISKYERE